MTAVVEPAAEHEIDPYGAPAHDGSEPYGYSASATLRAMPDAGRLVASKAVSTAPRVEYPLYVTTPGTYTVWARGYPADAAGDSPYVGLAAPGVGVNGFAPGGWTAVLPVSESGPYTLSDRKSTGVKLPHTRRHDIACPPPSGRL